MLKPWGFLSISNLYYRQNPPKDIVSQVSEIIATSIKPWGINEWRDLFLSQNLFELYHIDTHNLIPVNYEEILNYVEIFINKLGEVFLNTPRSMFKILGNGDMYCTV